MAKEYVIVDLETTGLDIPSEEIIEIAAVKVRRGLIVDQFSTLVACEKPIPCEIEELVGITDAMLVGQPSLAEAVTAFADFSAGAELVAHNAAFDEAFLHKYWPDERKWLDTLTLAQIAFPCAGSYSLVNLSAMLSISHDQAHRALSDALATAELFLQIDKKLDRLPARAKEDILLLAATDETPMGEFLRHKCQQVSTIAESTAPSSWQSQPSARKLHEDYQIDLKEITTYLGEDSPFAERFASFEARPEQLKMSLAVAKAVNSQSSLLVEAGTGTGKSLAYLLPAAIFATNSGYQVAISTHTKNLQDQLLNKDIPLLEKLLDKDIHAAIVKGRGNYLCRRMYRYLLSNASEQLRYFLMRVAVWYAQSKDGDGEELALSSYDRWKWQRIAASRENCSPFCPFKRKNACTVQKIRAEAARADLLILNHSLLIANAAVESGFLPPLPYLIVDEAQHLERAAEDQLTTKLDLLELVQLMGRLLRKEKGKQVGALSSLQRQAVEYLSAAFLTNCEQLLSQLEQGTETVMAEAEQFFSLLDEIFRPQIGSNPFYPAKKRILPSHRAQGEWLLVVQRGEAFGAALNELSRLCFRLLELFASSDDLEEKGKPAGYEELFGVASSVRELAATLEGMLDESDENYVTWLEFADTGRKPSIQMAPVEISQILQECLYQDTRTMVMTSATLSVNADFGYFKQRLGLDQLEQLPQEMVLSSPFYYRDQALFTVVNDLPDWTKCSEVQAVQAISDSLIDLLSASKGRAIVLFTSHYQLKAVYEQIRQPLKAQGITVLAHGVSGNPSSLLARLKKEEQCCILGANSFWEGVDVAGSALSLLVVVRLPFWPPNNPLAASRMERIEAEGRSSFSEYSMPQALIRFKQGFGRLIRSEQDSGVFCVLDRRIVEKSYGSRFIRSLPDMERRVGSSKEIAQLIENWLR